MYLPKTLLYLPVHKHKVQCKIFWQWAFSLETIKISRNALPKLQISLSVCLVRLPCSNERPAKSESKQGTSISLCPFKALTNYSQAWSLWSERDGNRWLKRKGEGEWEEWRWYHWPVVKSFDAWQNSLVIQFFCGASSRLRVASAQCRSWGSGWHQCYNMAQHPTGTRIMLRQVVSGWAWGTFPHFSLHATHRCNLNIPKSLLTPWSMLRWPQCP